MPQGLDACLTVRLDNGKCLSPRCDFPTISSPMVLFRSVDSSCEISIEPFPLARMGVRRT